jgi:hypothetical protein
MRALPVLFWSGLALLLITRGDGILEGEGPFDQQPPGTESKALSVNEQRASSGRTYRITAFRRADDQIYYVAQRIDGSAEDRKNWVSYLHNTHTKVRTLYRADAASPAALADLKKDWGL